MVGQVVRGECWPQRRRLGQAPGKCESGVGAPLLRRRSEIEACRHRGRHRR